MRTWRIVTKLGREVGLFVGKDEGEALELAVRSGKAERGQKGLRVLPHIAGRGPIVTLSAAVLRLMELAPRRGEPGYRRGPVEKEVARLLVVAAEPELEERLKALVPLGRVGDPATDIGPAVAFLVSQAAQYINGQTLVIDGGRFTTL